MAVDTIEITNQKTYIWIKELQEELGWQSRDAVFTALRAVLHTIRDRLDIDEAAHLSAQLPMLLRGLYFEDWKPSRQPVKYDRKEFLDTVNKYFARSSVEVDPEKVTHAVIHVLEKQIASGEIEDIKRVMPKQLREFWNT